MPAWTAIPRRLQWRLTLSYTLVAVAVVLVLEVAVLGGVVSALYRADILPTRLEAALQQKAQEITQLIGAGRLDRPVLLAWFEGLKKRGDWQIVDEAGFNFDLSPFDPQEALLVVTDPSGSILAHSWEGTSRAGERLVGIPARQLLKQALAGTAASGELKTREADGTLVAAAPVYGLDGQLQGALLVRVFIEPGFGPAEWVGILAATVLPSACLLLPLAGLVSIPFGYLTSRGQVRRLNVISRASQAWSNGDFSVSTGDRSPDELGQVSRRLDQMAAQLRDLLAERQNVAMLAERNRLALELHDSVKQQAFAVSAQLGAVRALMPRDPAAADLHLQKAEQLMDELRQELAHLILELRPPVLEGRGLAAALGDYLARWSQQSGIPTSLQTTGEPATCREVDQALFRIAQEALANVARHSAANQVALELVYRPGNVSLAISDNGRGFDPARVQAGVGLRSMQERARAAGGSVVIESTPGRGTSILARCPLTGG